jgi:hypothetical protein
MPPLTDSRDMARENLRATLLGFAGALVVFGVLFYLAGVEDIISQLADADTGIVFAVFLATLGWLVAWGGSLRTVLGVLGVPISLHRAFLVFTGAMFSNNITPFGQAGGEPVTALLISRSADAEYETSLAAIASVDTLNFVPSITIALIGAGYFATEVAIGRRIEAAIFAIGVLAVVVPSAVYLGWQRRYELEARVVNALTPVIRRLTQSVPRVPVPTAEGVESRINGFFRAIERIATNPRELALALGLSATGWLLQMVGLWLAFYAIGSPIPFSIALFVVPIGAIAGVTPLPGGAGGIEWTLTILVDAALPAVGFDTAAAGVVIFRAFVYWTPTLLGAVVMSVTGARRGLFR